MLWGLIRSVGCLFNYHEYMGPENMFGFSRDRTVWYKVKCRWCSAYFVYKEKLNGKDAMEIRNSDEDIVG